jgi:hypothetical protein
MAAVFESSEVATNGAVAVTLVGAPGSGEQKEVFSVPAWNRDTATRTLTLRKVGGAVSPFDISVTTIEAGQKADLLGAARAIVLDFTGETITVVSDATAATAEPLVHYAAFKVP